MRERSEQLLRLLCGVLLAVLLAEVAFRIYRSNPLAKLRIPALPGLAEAADSSPGAKGATNSQAKAVNAASGAKGTNAAAVQGVSTNGTNVVARKDTAKAKDGDAPGAATGTNNAVSSHGASTNGTKVAARDSAAAETNSLETEASGKDSTNSPAARVSSGKGTNIANAKRSSKAGTNSAPELVAQKGGSNSVARAQSGKGGTNNVAASGKSGKGTNANSRAEMAMAGGGPPGMPGMGKKLPDLPMPIQARVDRVVDSELLGPVFHPMPTALMGIAGNVAFLRAPSGQTGMVKEGDEMGGIKLLRIGVNRVLVEEEGNKKELMIFEGLGGQPLESK